MRRQIGDAVFIDVAFLYIRPISRKPASVFLADDYCVFAAAFHIRKIMQHIGEILFHERIVAVEFIVLIRQNDYGAAPARRTSAAAEKRGRMLNVAVIYVLTIDDIPHPLFIHFTHVEYMHRGLAGSRTAPDGDSRRERSRGYYSAECGYICRKARLRPRCRI